MKFRTRWSVWPIVVGALLLARTCLVPASEPQAGWPIVVDGCCAPPPVVADVDGDGIPEIVVGIYGGGLGVYRADGTVLPGWPFNPGGGSFGGKPVVGDIDGDGEQDLVYIEAVSQTLGRRIFAVDAGGQLKPGWPAEIFPHNATTYLYLALGDLDGDGAQEVVVPTEPYAHLVYAYKGDGGLLEGWPVDLELPPGPEYTNEIYISGFGVGDVDFDGTNEVVVVYLPYDDYGIPMSSPIWLIGGDGTMRDGWPLLPPWGGDLSNPMIADLDADYEVELVVPGRYMLYAFHSDGTMAFPYQIPSGTWFHNACADMDGDGDLEVILTGYRLRVYDMQYGLLGESDPSVYSFYVGASVGDVNGDGAAEICVWSAYTGDDPEIVLHLLSTDFTDLPGWPKVFPYDPPAQAIFATAMADLDGDGDMEIIHTFDDELHVWDQPNPGSEPPRVEWGMMGNDPLGGGFYHAGAIPDAVYLRGDANRNGAIDLADALVTIGSLFLEEENDCPAQLDFDGDGDLGVSDPLALLTYLFLAGPPPEEPFPACAPAPEGDPLPCVEFVCPE